MAGTDGSRGADPRALAQDDDGQWRWYLSTPPGASLADELAALAATGALGALLALGHDRFRACGSPTCDGVVVPTNRAGRRRYCTPELCGNRVSVANHRARRRSP